MLCVNHAYQKNVGTKPHLLKEQLLVQKGKDLKTDNHQTYLRTNQSE